MSLSLTILKHKDHGSCIILESLVRLPCIPNPLVVGENRSYVLTSTRESDVGPTPGDSRWVDKQPVSPLS